MTTAMDEAEIVVLRGSLAGTEAPSVSPSGSKRVSAPGACSLHEAM